MTSEHVKVPTGRYMLLSPFPGTQLRRDLIDYLEPEKFEYIGTNFHSWKTSLPGANFTLPDRQYLVLKGAYPPSILEQS